MNPEKDSRPKTCRYCGKVIDGERGRQSATKDHVECAYQTRLQNYSDKRTTEERRQYFRERYKRRQQELAIHRALNSKPAE